MLTPADRAILDLERTWWRVPGPKEWAMLEDLGMDAVAYYRRLAEVLWTGAAYDYDPLTVRRLRRIVGSPVGRTAEGT